MTGEMREALAKLRGGHVEEAEVDLVMKECDEDGNGTVDELEFVAWFRSSELAKQLRKQVKYEKKLAQGVPHFEPSLGPSPHFLLVTS